MIEMKQLEAFERVAREGNFTRAAEGMRLSQPAISTRIAALEKTLGGHLFERGGRQLRLTQLGRLFLPYAERMLTVLLDGVQAVHGFTEGKVGHVAIAALDALAMNMLSETMRQFRQSTLPLSICDLHILRAFLFLRAPTVFRDLLNEPVHEIAFHNNFRGY